LDDEEMDYEKVRHELSDRPDQSAEQLAEATGVDLECVLRLLDEGRIQASTGPKEVKCGRCGAPAISMSKKLCESCLQALNTQLAMEQGRVKLPQRKEVKLGSGMHVLDSLEEKRSGDSRRKKLLDREDNA
jgi:hypothetical protein